VLRTLLIRLWRARRASLSSPGPAIFFQLPLTFIYTIPYSFQRRIRSHLTLSIAHFALPVTGPHRLRRLSRFQTHSQRGASAPRPRSAASPRRRASNHQPTQIQITFLTFERQVKHSNFHPAKSALLGSTFHPCAMHAHIRRRRCSYAAEHMQPR
jgi:hypothetical protein